MKNFHDVIEMTLQPGERRGVSKVAKYVRCMKASAKFALSIGSGPAQEFEAGVGVSTEEEFEVSEVINPNTVPITVQLAYGAHEIHDSRMVLSGSVAVGCGGAGFSDVRQSIGTTPELLLSANANRTSAIIRAGDAALCLGPDGAVTYAEPATIGAGQSLTIAHKGAVWGVRQSGSAMVGIYEEVA